MPNPVKKGVITLSFDDAYRDTYKYAIKYLSKFKIKSTIAAALSSIGKTLEERPVMGIRELKKAIKAGHEIASHTLSHPNLFKLSLKDKKRAFSEIVESKKELERLLKYKVSSFVFPYIKKNISRALIQVAKEHYKSIRVTTDRPYFDRIPIKDPHKTIGFAITVKYPLSYLNRLVDYAQQNNFWFIEVFHLVGRKNSLSAHRPKPYRYFMHIDDFKKHIQYILSKEVVILTQKEAVKKFI